MSTEIQDKLNRYCLINRKYQLLDYTNFLSNFRYIETHYLSSAWVYSNQKIYNHEIIKNTNELPKDGKQKISDLLQEFNFESSDLYYYLNSYFDVKVLKLEEERIERRLRNILAKRHQKILESEIEKLNKAETLYEIKRKIILRSALTLIIIAIFSLFFGSRIRDGFTSIEVLTERIYQKKIYKYNGSICRDGSRSRSQGRGTCSWHGGVSYKFYEGQHKLTKKECREIAKKRSWIE
jgi:hypothetical protein